MHEPDNSFKTKSVQVLNVAKMQKSAVLLTSTKAHKGYTTSYSGEKSFLQMHILDRSIVWVLYLSPHLLALARDEERQTGIAISKHSNSYFSYFNNSYPSSEPNTQLYCCGSQPETGRVLIAKIKCQPKLIKPCNTLKIITKEI